jgi:hypothetical protein
MSRHNNTIRLLHDLLDAHNGGRWPILNMDLGSKLVRDFKTKMHIETIAPQQDHTLQSLEATQEGLEKDKVTMNHLTIIPNTILPKHKRPKHHKPNIINSIW